MNRYHPKQIDCMENYLETAKDILLQRLKDQPIKAYLFGSRAKGNARRNSDIDIALSSNLSDLLWVLSQIREDFEESSIPYHVDVVDLNSFDDAIKQKILKDAILWKD